MPNLRLMVDEDYWSLVPHLRQISNKIDVIATRDCGLTSGTKDPKIIRGTRENNRILVTLDDNTIKCKDFPPCTHGGVIFIQNKNLSEEGVKEVMRIFFSSGKRQKAKGHMTYLYVDHAIIKTHDEYITVNWYVSNKKTRYEAISRPITKEDLLRI